MTPFVDILKKRYIGILMTKQFIEGTESPLSLSASVGIYTPMEI